VIDAANGAYTLTGGEATLVPGSPAILIDYALPEPHPHPLADHDDPIAASVELAVVVVALFVAFRLVAVRILSDDAEQDTAARLARGCCAEAGSGASARLTSSPLARVGKHVA
jgi:hypothetical protein